jgi:hypothetical protein
MGGRMSGRTNNRRTTGFCLWRSWTGAIGVLAVTVLLVTAAPRAPKLVLAQGTAAVDSGTVTTNDPSSDQSDNQDVDPAPAEDAEPTPTLTPSDDPIAEPAMSQTDRNSQTDAATPSGADEPTSNTVTLDGVLGEGINLNVSTDAVDFGDVDPGSSKSLEGVVTVTVSSTAGGWNAGSCYVSAVEVGTLAASDLAWKLEGAMNYMPFSTVEHAEPGCIPSSAKDEGHFIYDYKLTVPSDAPSGPFRLTITYVIEG